MIHRLSTQRPGVVRQKLPNCQPRIRCAPPQAQKGGLGDDELDVAVFRFTLGIPGFEDRFIPRVVGLVGGAVLGINHILSPNWPVPIAQGRAEVLCAVLALILVVVPEIEERLREAQPGRGRKKTAATIEGSTNAFALGEGLNEKAKQELAFASFVLLKNTNSCGVIVLKGAEAVMARGALGTAVVTPGQAAKTLSAIHKDISSSISSGDISKVYAGGPPNQIFLPDRLAMSGAGVTSWASVPAGANCALLQRIPGSSQGMLVLFSERPRAFSDRELKWAGAMASKLGPFL